LVFKVLLDTSMLMIMIERRVDIFGQIEDLLQGRIEFIVPKAVSMELSKISQEKSQRARYARLAMTLAEKCKPWQSQPGAEESIDDHLVRVTGEMRGIVATGDTGILRKARNANIPVIYVKRDLRLAVEGIEPAYR
jgi:rRNA-processing protein FCF1